MKRSFVALLLAALLLTSCTSDGDGVTEPQTASTAQGQSTEQGERQTQGVTQTEYISENACDTPRTVVVKNIAPDTVMVAGVCEEGCTLRVWGEGVEEKTIKPDGENFVFSVTVPARKTLEVCVTAKKEGRDDSQTLRIKASYSRGAEDLGLFVTNDSRLLQNAVLDDVYHTAPISKGKLYSMKYVVRDKLRDIRTRTGKNTELIYLIAPHPTDVYTEGVDGVNENNDKIKQVKETLEQIDGVTVIDAGEILRQNKDKGKLYYCLDTHWTELGAYFGYYALMSEIAHAFPDAAPHELDEYDIEDVTLTYADMIYYAKTQDSGMKETAPFLHAKYTPLAPYDEQKPEEADIWTYTRRFFEKTAISRIDNDALPTAQLIMDSYGLNCIAYIAEHFSTLVCNPVWNYTLDLEQTSELKPDYVIQILNVRTIDKIAS